MGIIRTLLLVLLLSIPAYAQEAEELRPLEDAKQILTDHDKYAVMGIDQEVFEAIGNFNMQAMITGMTLNCKVPEEAWQEFAAKIEKYEFAMFSHQLAAWGYVFLEDMYNAAVQIDEAIDAVEDMTAELEDLTKEYENAEAVHCTDVEPEAPKQDL